MGRNNRRSKTLDIWFRLEYRAFRNSSYRPEIHVPWTCVPNFELKTIVMTNFFLKHQ